MQNFLQIRPLGAFWQMGEIQLIFSSIVNIPFLLTDLQVKPPGRFSRAMARTTQGCASLKVKKFKVNIQPLKNPLKVENSAQKQTLKLSPINGP